MSWVAVAIGGSAVVGAGASMLSSKSQKKGAESGAASEAATASKNIAMQKELAAIQREDFAPWRDVGQQALDKIWSGFQSGEFEVGKIDVTKDPGYQFRMDQGLEAQDKSAAARGRLLSGAQIKGTEEYAQGFASQEYANAYARESNEKARQFNILSGLSQGGQSSAAGQAQTTSQLASTSGNIMSNLGQSQNIAQQNIGSARAGAYTDTAQSVNQAAQNWLTYKQLGAGA